MQSDRVVKALKLGDAMFKQLFGVQKETFHTMHTFLHQAFQSQHRQGGRPPKLTVGDKLLLTLQYYREYRSMDHLAYEYEVHKSLVYRAILWVEQTLRKELGVRIRKRHSFLLPTPNSSLLTSNSFKNTDCIILSFSLQSSWLSIIERINASSAFMKARNAAQHCVVYRGTGSNSPNNPVTALRFVPGFH